ncbi:hypothetical protein [Nannocystis sp.]|uniref:hypothetical protein n=1 Tax=Nannocystis sp. TaxID=1962667 RepID=UPI0025DF5093|nr:hypothetical protein [Nannocystis sp.]MBK7829964.1 hypothetical protein [Nannocystis sp.]
MPAPEVSGGELSEGARDLIARIVKSERKIVLLLGSALTMQPGPGLSGVPDVRGVVNRLRTALAGDGGVKFDEAVARADESGSGRDLGVAYREGFDALLRRGGGQDAVDRVILEAVLEAHEFLDNARRARVSSANREVRHAACQELLDAPAGWLPLRPSVVALGEILQQDPGRLVFTTNFDPLIEVAVKRAGGTARRTVTHARRQSRTA